MVVEAISPFEETVECYMDSIAFIILTYNEERHIARCLQSLMPFGHELLVIDSFSTDDTCRIAEKLGAKVYQHPFKNQAQQFNWALENCPIESGWIWRVDADEYISADLGERVMNTIQTCGANINGIYVNKRIVFMGRPLMHGGWYPAPQIKVIRKGFGASEKKWMDEHLIVFSGDTVYIDGDQTDENLNDMAWWSHKHVNYAYREAINMLMMAYGIDTDTDTVKPDLWGNGVERKRWFKIKYARAPLFLRPFAIFFIRYVLKGGFLDGRQGFIWYILQSFWYRMLVDVYIWEIKRACRWKKRQ